MQGDSLLGQKRRSQGMAIGIFETGVLVSGIVTMAQKKNVRVSAGSVAQRSSHDSHELSVGVYFWSQFYFHCDKGVARC